MPLPIRPDAVARYEAVRSELRRRCPEAWDDVVELCRRLPGGVDAPTVWRIGRDKPCWSNIRVKLGERIAADLERSSDFDSAATLASDAWDIAMLEGTRNPGWRRNANFELRGARVRQFVGGLTRGGLASFLWRLYAIRSLAKALEDGSLRVLVDELIQRGGRLPAERLEGWTTAFAREAGTGWGFTTVNHLLTDLGASAKNDLHVMRSVIRMGLFPGLDAATPDDEIRRRQTRIGHEVVRIIVRLSEQIRPAPESGPRAGLRELDKVLMEWSRQSLVRPMA